MTDEELFAAALERPAGPDRRAFLDAACAGDPGQRERVGMLLAGDELAQGLFGRRPDPASTPYPNPAGSWLVTPLAADAVFAGKYKLRQKLGEGGMGEVWVADQDQPVQRRVAVKVIRRGLDSGRMFARFEAERQALALMDHPNIAKFLDAGVAGDQPYFVMEVVKGLPITKYCDEARLSPRERVALFVPVCQAVQHAHQKGVIHRDLKPSNILVTEVDGRPAPKVIDFGVAKATGPRLTEHTIYTEVGSVIGTLEYMAPEQADLGNLDVDTRADVYALGAVLYELLTGTVPFPRERLAGAGLAEMLRIIKEEDPPRPSTRLSGAPTVTNAPAAHRAEPRKVAAVVKGELDWIVMRALAKDRNRRYESATGLAADLDRYLSDRPVSAGPPSAAYRLRKFVRRHRAGVAAAVVVAVALGVLAAGAGVFAWQAANQRREERDRRDRTAEAVATLLDQGEAALRADRVEPAAVALEAAERRAADGEGEQHAGRLAALRADLDMLRALNAVDTFRWTPVEDQYPTPRAVAARWQDALAAYGVTPHTGDPEAARIKRSAVRDRLLAALDGWLAAEPAPAVWVVLRGADPDPYRHAVRNALSAGDQARAAELAGRPEALAQPARFATVLGQLADVPAERRQAVLANALRPRPGDLGLLMALGNAYPSDRAAGSHNRARLFHAAVAAHPDRPAPRNNLGLALRETGDLAGAADSLREATRLDPGFFKAHFNLGNVLRELRDAAGAAASFREAIRLDPASPGARSNLGLALWDQGNREEAIACFREAIRLDPKYPIAHYNLGTALRALRHTDDAIAAFREAIRLRPDYAAAHANLGNALRAKGDLPGAVASLREAARHDPADARIHANLGSALRATGDLSGAVARLAEAVRLDPKLSRAHHDLAWLLATGPDGLRDGRRAVEHGTRACELTDWKDPSFVDTLAAAHAAAGDFEKAVEFQKQALAAPNLPKGDVKAARERLERYTRKESYRDPALAPRDVKR